MIYVGIILLTTALIALGNNVFVAPMVGVEWWNISLWTILFVVVVIAIDGVVAWIVNHLPKKWFSHDIKCFSVGAKEKKFYEKLKIRKWKDRVPELGALGGFRKNKIADPSSLEYVERFLLEICYGEAVHFLSLFLGFLVMLVNEKYALTIGLPVAIVNFFMNIPSLFILRYNSYKLKILYKSNLKKLERQRKKQEEELYAEVAITD